MKRLSSFGMLLGLLCTCGCDAAAPAGSAPSAITKQAQEQTASGTTSEPNEGSLLVPDGVSIPDLDTEEKRKGKGIPESAMIVDLGGTVRTYAEKLPFPVVLEQGEGVVLLGKDDAKLWISAKIFDEAGKLVCKIEKNKLEVNGKDAFRIEQTPHTLTVFESQAKEGDAKETEAKKVLAIHFLNDHAVRLFGDFYSAKGCHVVVNESGVLFGHGRSFSNTGLNGVSVVLDPPSGKLAQAETSPSAKPGHGNDDSHDVAGDVELSAGDVGAAMTAAAQAFLSSLQPEELAKATLKFDDPARLDWTNIPKKQRKGLPIREMNAEQSKLCHKLLRSALSTSGYDKAAKIMSLENNLREGEKNLNTGWARDPRDYYLTIFGKPAASDRWGWSFEGHHLSLNFVVSDGQVVSETPSFWGANPATVLVAVPSGPETGTRTLAGEEQLAFDLVGELSEAQRARAMIADTAPPEYRAVGTPQPPHTAPEGLSAAEMSEVERNTLRQLLATYTSHLAPPLAAVQLADIDAKGFDRIYFAWAGATTPGKGHYYRIQGPSFVLELVNVQSDPAGNLANHIHSVWRSLEGDFGATEN